MYINGLVFSLSDSVTVNFAPYGTMFKKGKYRIIFEIFEERALRKAESDTSSPIYLSYEFSLDKPLIISACKESDLLEIFK